MKKTICLIEDDADARLLFTHVLSKTGYDVRQLDVGNSILDINEEPADLYILDNCLPNIDGIALTKFLRIKQPTKEIPILIVSGDSSVRSKAKNAGASGFVSKPFEVNAFLNIVNTLLNDPCYRSFEPQHLQAARFNLLV
jgi:two-component system chemotaxis response regulator CheY